MKEFVFTCSFFNGGAFYGVEETFCHCQRTACSETFPAQKVTSFFLEDVKYNILTCSCNEGRATHLLKSL